MAKPFAISPSFRLLSLPLLVVVAACLSANLAHAAETVGQVLLSVGQTQATDASGAVRPLARRAPVQDDDVLHTGSDGRLDIRMQDDGRLALQANSSLRLVDYQWQPQQHDGQVTLELIKGGMRSLSGQIGSAHPEHYQLNSRVASIGIRGTDFQVFLCDAQCGQQYATQPGLAGGVSSGSIVITSPTEQRVVRAGQFFYVDGQNGVITILDRAPAMLPQDSGWYAAAAAAKGPSDGASLTPLGVSGAAIIMGIGIMAIDGGGSSGTTGTSSGR
ncbi:hypothetical protein C4K68_07205 [Pokkaliibacter plantistimulans]|uniref:FecR protein domain-containing protein n=1 Tax=Proteobacteria bacterium 228 TaxID=2083153 RepID=A0A2S5KU31_9PROT|nr:FecR family protein [Pokkaliibacter plantistimulans]PPC78029.1 hypothetical protein C4K68_07205 [Pokkaliibacter plantistimulans]